MPSEPPSRRANDVVRTTNIGPTSRSALAPLERSVDLPIEPYEVVRIASEGYPLWEPVAVMVRRNCRITLAYADLSHRLADLIAQATPDADGIDAFQKRYAKAVARDFDGDPKRITEMDALVAYLQMLGTLVDFKTYKADAPENRR